MHIGIIPDGHRRYAREKNITNHEAYTYGFNVLINLIETFFFKQDLNNVYFFDLTSKINEVTIYISSIDNITKRNENDVNCIIDMINKYINYYETNKKLFFQNEIQINFVGEYLNYDIFPLEKMMTIIDETKNFNLKTLNLAVAYDPRYELLNAYKYNSENISILYKNLYVSTQIDVVFRTGYETRTSGFFPMQTLYSEWFFIQKHWPEMTIEILKNLLQEYTQREKRFGK